MKDFMFLKFLDKFKGLFTAAGIDYDIMRKILHIKLTMDGRRVPTVFSNNSKRKAAVESRDQNNFIKSLWVYVLLGLFMIPIVIMGKNYIFQMSLVFGVILFMVMSSLISDFSTVLLDIRDKNIISTKPINSKTISMAKTLHVLIYMFFITAAITGPALVISLIRHGFLFFIIFLIEIILMDLFIVALTALLYLLILRFFDGEKLKDIINYVQIGLSIAIAIGYQLIGRLFQFVNINAVFVPKWWQYFIIPVWFGGPFELLLNGNFNVNYIAFSLLAVFGSLAAIILYINLMPSFERNLQKLSENASKAERAKKPFQEFISKIICVSKDERLFFRFAADMMKNEREFKLKVYPSLGFSIIFPFIFILNGLMDANINSISSGRMYLNIYFCALMLPTAIMMVKYSGKYKAAWIYKVIPVKNKRDIFKGTLKAFIVKLLLPVYFIESIIFIIIFRIRILPDLIVVFLTMMLLVVICFRMFKQEYPFSQSFETVQQGQGLLIIPFMILIGIFAAVHFALTYVNFGVLIYLLVLLVVNILTWKFGFNN